MTFFSAVLSYCRVVILHAILAATCDPVHIGSEMDGAKGYIFGAESLY